MNRVSVREQGRSTTTTTGKTRSIIGERSEQEGTPRDSNRGDHGETRSDGPQQSKSVFQSSFSPIRRQDKRRFGP
jgi:hypothetical protein